MQDPATISAALQAQADDEFARKRARQISPLRGLRGVPPAAVVRVLVSSWRASRAALPKDEAALHRLFGTAFEDGLVAIGLLAAALPAEPLEALDLTDRWIAMVDDLETADSLGWMLLGPGLLASGEPFSENVRELLVHPHPIRRRVGVMALMALMPVPLEGISAAALREQLDQRRLSFVEETLSTPLQDIVPLAIKDEDAHVRKATARVLRQWGVLEPDVVEALLAAQRGGVPKFIREEAERGIQKGRRPPRPPRPQRA